MVAMLITLFRVSICTYVVLVVAELILPGSVRRYFNPLLPLIVSVGAAFVAYGIASWSDGRGTMRSIRPTIAERIVCITLLVGAGFLVLPFFHRLWAVYGAVAVLVSVGVIIATVLLGLRGMISKKEQQRTSPHRSRR